jgi:CHAT domain-containing protein
VGKDIEKHISDSHPSFFINACHGGKQTLGIKGLSSWANHLIRKGAGLVINPQWKVDDKLAYKFALVFYQELFKGKTIAEATREARLSIKIDHDSTWLAYSVYGHPNAKIS